VKLEDALLFNEDLFDHRAVMVLSFTLFPDPLARYFEILEAAKRDLPVAFSSRIDGALQPLWRGW